MSTPASPAPTLCAASTSPAAPPTMAAAMDVPVDATTGRASTHGGGGCGHGGLLHGSGSLGHGALSSRVRRRVVHMFSPGAARWTQLEP